MAKVGQSQQGSVRLEKSEKVAQIIIDRPEKHNALTPQMYLQIRDICQEINDDNDLHSAILYGAGEKAFCAGSDINALKEYQTIWDWRTRTDYATQLRQIRKPLVCAIKGWALGGGLELALAADIRIAATSAVFSAPEVSFGWNSGSGATQFLPKLVGYGQAMKLLLSGERINAAEALRIGLIEELVEPGNEVSRSMELAQQIARYPPFATEAVKTAVRASLSGNLANGLQLENELMSLCFSLLSGGETLKIKQNTE